jgi:hypothetical protein
MSIFVCTNESCPNKDVVYDFGDEHPRQALCGGCKTTLYPR